MHPAQPLGGMGRSDNAPTFPGSTQRGARFLSPARSIAPPG